MSDPQFQPANDEFQAKVIVPKALAISRIRKALDLAHKFDPNFEFNRGFNHYIDFAIPSTDQECKTDWAHAIAAIILDRVSGKSADNSACPECFFHFEGVWLENVKECAAYYHWLDEANDIQSQHSETIRIHCYYEACSDLRKYLAAEHKTGDVRIALEYLCGKYLGSDKAVDETKIANLITQKEQRLSGYTWDAFNIASRFARVFYGNIYAALSGKEPEAIKEVLRASKNGGSRLGMPSIINGFELLLMVLYLDGATVKRLWEDGASGITWNEIL